MQPVSDLSGVKNSLPYHVSGYRILQVALHARNELSCVLHRQIIEDIRELREELEAVRGLHGQLHFVRELMYEAFVSQYFEEVVLPGDVGVLLNHLEHLDKFVGLVEGRVSDAGEHPAVEVLGLNGYHVGGLRDEVERADGDGDGEGGGEGANHHQDDHEDQLQSVVLILLSPLTRHFRAVAHCIQCGHDEEVDVQVEL